MPICPICNKEYRKNGQNQKYCCKFCAKEAQKRRDKAKYEGNDIKTCEICNLSFKKTGHNQKFCSTKCKRKNEKQARKIYMRMCENCNIEFETVVKARRFCSVWCSNQITFCKLKVEVACGFCGKKILVTESASRRKKYCSRECHFKSKKGKSPTEETKKKISASNKGKKFTEEHKRKIGLKHKGRIVSKETRQKSSKSHKGQISSFKGKHHSEETKNKLSKIMTGRYDGEKNPFAGKKHTKETKELLSKNKTEGFLSGKFHSWYQRDFIFSQKINKTMYYRSSWELAAILFFDKSKNITNYCYESFSIKYCYNGCIKRYVPDFLVFYSDNTRKLIEIKPKYLCETPINFAKFAAGRKWCEENGAVFEIWTEEQIYKLDTFE